MESTSLAIRPSVLLITLDTTRADRLGAYGSTRGLTPNLDRLAREGVVFENAVVQAAVTPVSHASILTGLEPFTHGLRVMHGLEDNRLDERHATAAEIFAEAGYETAAFVSAFPVSERFGFRQGFSVFDADFPDSSSGEAVADDGTVNTGMVQRRADHTTDRALEWLQSSSRPFFAWVHYFDAHDPLLLPPDEFVDAYRPIPSAERDRLRALYDLEIAFMDREIGRLLDSLKASGDSDELVVAVIADHGEGLGDHDWWTHGILYQEQIRVPMLLWQKGQVPGRIGGLVRSIDLLPTLLDLLDVKAPPMDGRSLLPLLEGGTAWETEPAYADSVNVLTYAVHPTIRDVKDDMLFAVIQPPWKYIHHLQGRDKRELFNLQDDPDELRNIYGQEPEVVSSMQRLLRNLDVMPESVSGRPRMSEEDRDRLRALGYLD